VSASDGAPGGLLAALVAALVVAVLAAAADARTIYRWKDERGNVHFSDVPPAVGTPYETEHMPPPPPVDTPTVAEASKTPSPGQPQAATGPANVVITDRRSTPGGGSLMEYSGKVKNEGGETAHDVAVLIRVVELNSGHECIKEYVDVSPADLGGSEAGTYRAQFTSPCFLGPTNVDITPDWD
jgi:hypothetical protein